MDGRDVPPTSGADYIKEMESFIEKDYKDVMSIGVVSCRYYAMDRDKRWERVKLAYDALTLGEGRQAESGSAAIEFAYANDETDEFILPTICNKDALVKDGDSIIFCNFRPDRAREITRAFVDNYFDGFERKSQIADLRYVCMTQYDATMPNVEVAFPPASINNTLGEYLSSLDKTQLRIAETEKYAHVTFFFNGGVEAPNTLEDRILVPSPQVATYDLQPEMSAYQVTEKVVEEIKSSKYDCIILNFANPDMVGHTGVFDAAVKAIEAVDECVGKVVAAMLEADGQILITADHGNADDMIDEVGNVVTAHSTNPVPLVHVAANPVQLKEGGKLCDIAPTMLTLMGLPVPSEMTGSVLV
jgi:2,3-bisphosphoglycerate-independent phosphoglycerate mutase